MIIIKFIFIGMLFIVSNNNLHLVIGSERADFYNLFYSWFTELFSHLSKITSYVVDSEWLPSKALPGGN